MGPPPPDLTAQGPGSNISRLMSPQSPESRPHGRLPETLDAFRLVTARGGFEGVLQLSSMSRLRDMLFDGGQDAEGEVRYAIEFDRDALQVPYVELRIDAALPLLCQRTLKRFEQPVHVLQRLALVQNGDKEGADGGMEALEAALPPDYEPLLLPVDGMLDPTALIEDELILAIPVVPVSPGSQAQARDWPVPEQEAAKVHPFAALERLKKH